jgi:hypothetical protein
MALDLKAWLKEMGVKDDQLDVVVPVLTPAADAIEKGVLRQADYSKHMNDLKVKQQELDAANERLNQEIVEWGETKAKGEPITAKMERDLADAKAEVTRLHTVITTKAEQLGIDPKSIIGEVQPPAADSKASQPDLTGYVKMDDLNQRIGAVGQYLMDLPVEIQDLADEHFELTGERLNRKEIVAEVKRRATDKTNRNPDGTLKLPADARAIWEEKHQIPEKRKAKAEEAHTRDLKAAEDRGYERARTEQALPGDPPAGKHAIVLRRTGDQAHVSKLPEGQRREAPTSRNNRVSAAASALATHRYRQQGTKPGA